MDVVLKNILIPLVSQMILLIISFKIFDRTMFDRSDPDYVERLPMDLGYELKRLAFPVILVAYQALARSVLNGLIAVGGTEFLEEVLASAVLPIGDEMGVTLQQFDTIINVIVLLIVLVPVVITAISCIRSGKTALIRFMSLLAVSALICGLFGTLINILVFTAVTVGDFLAELCGWILTFLGIFTGVVGTVLLFASLLLWLMPNALLEFLGIKRKQKEAHERWRQNYSGSISTEGGRSHSQANESSDTDFDRMPSLIRDENNNEWRKLRTFYGGAVYENCDKKEIEITYCSIESKHAQGGGINFHWY